MRFRTVRGPGGRLRSSRRPELERGRLRQRGRGEVGHPAEGGSREGGRMGGRPHGGRSSRGGDCVSVDGGSWSSRGRRSLSGWAGGWSSHGGWSLRGAIASARTGGRLVIPRTVDLERGGRKGGRPTAAGTRAGPEGSLVP